MMKIKFVIPFGIEILDIFYSFISGEICWSISSLNLF